MIGVLIFIHGSDMGFYIMVVWNWKKEILLRGQLRKMIMLFGNR